MFPAHTRQHRRRLSAHTWFQDTGLRLSLGSPRTLAPPAVTGNAAATTLAPPPVPATLAPPPVPAKAATTLGPPAVPPAKPNSNLEEAKAART